MYDVHKKKWIRKKHLQTISFIRQGRSRSLACKNSTNSVGIFTQDVLKIDNILVHSFNNLQNKLNDLAILEYIVLISHVP